MSSRAREAVMVAAFALPPAFVLGLVGLVAGPVVALVVFVVVAAAIAAWVVRGADARVRRAIGGHPADPQAHARPVNLLEGLSFTAGLRPPELVVVDEPGANLAVWGRRPQGAVVAVTAGLLAALPRIELEGALAAA
ncbi:MAG TPA: hypothetical protein VFP61_13335, partial [Acidimicrobiales bacterium]|nr:hypothetical protein [Acidimicrobiales bacterium]